MFTLCYATRYIFQSLKLMVFQLEWQRPQITILPLQMNSTPWWGEKSTILNSRELFFRGGLLIVHFIQIHMHCQAHTIAPTNTDRHCILDWVCECQNRSMRAATTGGWWASGEAVRSGISFSVDRLDPFLLCLSLSLALSLALSV